MNRSATQSFIIFCGISSHPVYVLPLTVTVFDVQLSVFVYWSNTTLATRINFASTLQWQHTAPLENSPQSRKIGRPTLSACNNILRQMMLTMLPSNALFCSALLARTYQLLCILMAPAKPKYRTFKEIVDAVQAHYQPKPSVIAERLTSTPAPARLENRSQPSSLSCEGSLNIATSGTHSTICSVTASFAVLTTKGFSAASSLDIRQGHGTGSGCRSSRKNTRKLEKVTAPGVHKVSHDHHTKEEGAHRSTPIASFYHCGGRHPSEKCHFRDEECHHCGKKGHIAIAFKTKQRENTQINAYNKPNWQSPRQRLKNQTTYHVEESDEEPEFENAILHLLGKCLPVHCKGTTQS